MKMKTVREVFARHRNEIIRDTVIHDGFAREQCGVVTNRKGSEPRKFSDHKGC